MRVTVMPKEIRCKVGDLVYATWYDHHEQEPIGGLGIVVGVEFSSTVKNWVDRIKILHNGRYQTVSQVFDPEEGKAYFEPKPSI
jgi:hypothetical protein